MADDGLTKFHDNLKRGTEKGLNRRQNRPTTPDGGVRVEDGPAVRHRWRLRNFPVATLFLVASTAALRIYPPSRGRSREQWQGRHRDREREREA